MCICAPCRAHLVKNGGTPCGTISRGAGLVEAMHPHNQQPRNLLPNLEAIAGVAHDVASALVMQAEENEATLANQHDALLAQAVSLPTQIHPPGYAD